MATLYGKHWLELWRGIPMADIKDTWRSSLERFDSATIAKALEFVKAEMPFPPTCPEFTKLCAQYAPREEPLKALPAPRTPIPAKVAAQLKAFKEKWGLKSGMLGE